jgi:hypothetical protein
MQVRHRLAEVALVLLAGATLVGCGDDGGGGSGGSATTGGTTATSGDGGASADGGGGSTATGDGGAATGTGGAGGAADKAANCADTFGDELTNSYGRVDGTVVAVVGPTDTQCPLFNDDHLIVQIMMNGAVYRMVVNVESIFYAEHQAPLVGVPWEEGWHTTGVALEYPTTFDLHSEDFEPTTMAGVVFRVTDLIDIGAPISVYANSSGGQFASSTHLIHSNDDGPDGAILLDPKSANPTYLLFRFGNQQF